VNRRYPTSAPIKSAVLLCCIISLGLIASCKGIPFSPEVPCSCEWVYGLHIEIRDEATGGPIGEGATVTVRDGDYEETVTAQLLPGPKVIALAAGERPGTYDISVTLAGYREWRKSGVRVRANVCHVIPVSVLAELVEE
jgi:hypothetical protein